MEKQSVNLTPDSLPRCFVLDADHSLIMECSARPGEKLKATAVYDSGTVELPSVFNRAVEVLERNCIAEQTESKAAVFGRFVLRVQLLRGKNTNHTAVTIAEAA